MSRWGNVDFEALLKLQKNLEKVAASVDDLCVRCTQKLAAQLINTVIKRTPVKSGALRRGWMAGKSSMSSGKVATKTTMQVSRKGTAYEIVVFNSVNYASYVEYGHRQEPGRYVPAIGKRLKNSWVKGQFMLKISEQELEAAAPRIINRLLKPYMEDIFKV